MNTFGGLALYDPRRVRKERLRFRRDAVAELNTVNTITIPSGRGATTGSILLKKSDSLSN